MPADTHITRTSFTTVQFIHRFLKRLVRREIRLLEVYRFLEHRPPNDLSILSRAAENRHISYLIGRWFTYRL